MKNSSLKIAVAGKGGVGKSTVAAALILMLAERGYKVLALDADPDANLASALGVPAAEQKNIAPVSSQTALIEERAETKTNEYGRVFKLNPDMTDVAEKLAYQYKGVSILTLGAVKNGGGGCACPESTFIRALVTDLVLYKNEALVMDMEAGIEHLGRATARGVNAMIVVAEPGKRAVDCAESVMRLSAEIGIKKLLFAGNKITCKSDEEYLRTNLPRSGFVAMIPYSEALRSADRDGLSVLDSCDNKVKAELEKIYNAITI